MTLAYRTARARSVIRDLLSVTRMPFSFTQTLFIILGFVHAGGTDPVRILLAVIALGPTLIYGGIYLLNDIADRNFDRQHPKKKQRSITSGRISVKAATTLAAILITAGLAIASYIGFKFTVICLAVLTNNLAYSYGPRLKGRLYPGILSCSLNYPLRFLAGGSIISLGQRDALPALLLLLTALNGFSAYRIYDAKSKGIREKFLQETTLAAITRTTALAAGLIALTVLWENTLAALAAAVYMLAFSEINLRIVRRGVDFFQLLRIWKTLREKPELGYYTVMTAILGAVIVCIILKAA